MRERLIIQGVVRGVHSAQPALEEVESAPVLRQSGAVVELLPRADADAFAVGALDRKGPGALCQNNDIADILRRMQPRWQRYRGRLQLRKGWS